MNTLSIKIDAGSFVQLLTDQMRKLGIPSLVIFGVLAILAEAATLGPGDQCIESTCACQHQTTTVQCTANSFCIYDRGGLYCGPSLLQDEYCKDTRCYCGLDLPENEANAAVCTVDQLCTQRSEEPVCISNLGPSETCRSPYGCTCAITLAENPESTIVHLPPGGHCPQDIVTKATDIPLLDELQSCKEKTCVCGWSTDQEDLYLDPRKSVVAFRGDFCFEEDNELVYIPLLDWCPNNDYNADLCENTIKAQLVEGSGHCLNNRICGYNLAGSIYINYDPDEEWELVIETPEDFGSFKTSAFPSINYKTTTCIVGERLVIKGSHHYCAAPTKPLKIEVGETCLSMARSGCECKADGAEELTVFCGTGETCLRTEDRLVCQKDFSSWECPGPTSCHCKGVCGWSEEKRWCLVADNQTAYVTYDEAVAAGADPMSRGDILQQAVQTHIAKRKGLFKKALI
jgi:hypothetical protein